jgi:hypothetical protein
MDAVTKVSILANLKLAKILMKIINSLSPRTLFSILLILVVVALFLIIAYQSAAPKPADQTPFPVIPSDAAVTQSPVPAPLILPAFPGAEGYGSETEGGRFGKIIFVTNLNDTTDVNNHEYQGSLRWAIQHTWPDDVDDPYDQRRIIVFKVGGEIKLTDALYITNPFTTIAGQSAPGDGITLRGEELGIATHDVVIRYIRVRVGDEGLPTCCRDGINISTTNADSDVYNIIVDHSSVSWAIDENLSIWTEPAGSYKTHDITIQWSIISEGLHNSIHVDEGADTTDPHSMGMILGQSGYNITIHHNLFANNWRRNPRIAGIINSEVINNLIYGWGNAAIEFSGEESVTLLLNNYLKANAKSKQTELVFHNPMHQDSRVYSSGNFTDDSRNDENLVPVRINNPAEFSFSELPQFLSTNVRASSAVVAYDEVLKNAGVVFPKRDAVDNRIVKQVKTRTGRIIDSQNQVGGWPVYQGGLYPADNDNDGIPNDWETAHGLDPNNAGDASNFNALAPSGYTWIEEYINSLHPPVE